MKITNTLLMGTVVSLTGVASADTNVRFGFDSAELSASSNQALDPVIAESLQHPDQRIVLAGHADQIGAADYNVALSLRRALAVRGELIARGVDADRIVVVSYGEDGVSQGGFAADRRVSIKLTTDSVATIVDQAFALRGTSVTWETPMTTAQLEQPTTRGIATR